LSLPPLVFLFLKLSGRSCMREKTAEPLAS
jgi:hypothetical protein